MGDDAAGRASGTRRRRAGRGQALRDEAHRRQAAGQRRPGATAAPPTIRWWWPGPAATRAPPEPREAPTPREPPELQEAREPQEPPGLWAAGGRARAWLARLPCADGPHRSPRPPPPTCELRMATPDGSVGAASPGRLLTGGSHGRRCRPYRPRRRGVWTSRAQRLSPINRNRQFDAMHNCAQRRGPAPRRTGAPRQGARRPARPPGITRSAGRRPPRC